MLEKLAIGEAQAGQHVITPAWVWLMPAQALEEVAISQIMTPNAYTSAARDSLPSVSSSGGTAAQPEQLVTLGKHSARQSSACNKNLQTTHCTQECNKAVGEVCALCVTVPAQQRDLQLSNSLSQDWQSRLTGGSSR
jgi:hypothetical protein